LYDRGQQSLEDDKTKRPTYKRMGSGSILYEAFWGGEAEHFDVPATATTHGAATMDLFNNKLQTSKWTRLSPGNRRLARDLLEPLPSCQMRLALHFFR
jgi:hypothetical protein